MNYPIYAHQDLLAVLDERGALSRRLNLVSSHLAAHGRTSVVKSCKDVINRGWLRTPVAGNHRYLWWLRHSSAPASDSGFPKGSIVLRAVRHHDDHSLMQIGDIASDYVQIKLSDLEDDTFIAQPWTSQQNNFIRSEALVRILIGNPGSGKTTALWRAVTAVAGRRVLYLTWSTRLADTAKVHFDCFSDSSISVVTLNIRGFFGELLHRDVPFVSFEKSFTEFKKHLSYLDPKIIGNWKKHDHCLFAEARAIMFGMAKPEQDDKEISHLDAQSYLHLRGDTLGSAAENVPNIVNKISNLLRPHKWIPELLAASDAIKSMRVNGIPESLNQFDTIVVDEVQDLTRLELRALMDFHAHLSIARGEPPRLLLAGDEGQTVVPTHFKWSGLKDIVEESLSATIKNRTRGSGVEETRLDSNLRCPRNVRDVLDRASGYYAMLPKADRPGSQTMPLDGELHDARLLHADCATEEDAANLLSKLMEQQDIAVICIDEKIKKRISKYAVAKDIAQRILTPAEAKGLEFQSVCLINPGSHLLSFKHSAEEAGDLDDLSARTSLDQFRVAVSRATGDLVFVDINSTKQAISLSKQILGNPVETDAAGLEVFFQDIDSTAEDRVRAQLESARALADQDIRRSWSIANGAFRMLGDANLTNGVADKYLRAEVGKEILSLASVIIALPTHEEDDPKDLSNLIAAASNEAGIMNAQKLFDTLQKWLKRESSTRHAESCKMAVELLDGIASADPAADWILPAIRSVAQRLRADLVEATNYETSALRFAGTVDRWLKITGEIGDIESTVNTLRAKAFETLITKNQLANAEKILKLIPNDQRLDGMLHEANGRYSDAALCFEKAGEAESTLRNWRADGNWDKALAHASGEDAERLRWLAECDAIKSRKPSGINQWMTKEEKKRYLDLIKELGNRGS